MGVSAEPLRISNPTKSTRFVSSASPQTSPLHQTSSTTSSRSPRHPTARPAGSLSSQWTDCFWSACHPADCRFVRAACCSGRITGKPATDPNDPPKSCLPLSSMESAHFGTANPPGRTVIYRSSTRSIWCSLSGGLAATGQPELVAVIIWDSFSPTPGTLVALLLVSTQRASVDHCALLSVHDLWCCRTCQPI